MFKVSVLTFETVQSDVLGQVHKTNTWIKFHISENSFQIKGNSYGKSVTLLKWSFSLMIYLVNENESVVFCSHFLK